MARYFRWFFTMLIIFSISQSSCYKQMEKAGANISGAGGSMARFAIVGKYLYIVSLAELDVYDISDPQKPVFKNTAFVGVNMVETIFPYNDKLFIGSESGMAIYSITDPEKPVREATISHFRACDPVVSNDSLAYVTLRNDGSCGGTKNVLQVYDVRDIKKPTLLKEIGMSAPRGLGTRLNGLYVCQGSYGLTIFNLSNPSNPAAVKILKGEVYHDVIPYGNVLIAYIDKGIMFYDISNPIDPVLLSTMKG